MLELHLNLQSGIPKGKIGIQSKYINMIETFAAIQKDTSARILPSFKHAIKVERRTDKRQVAKSLWCVA